MSLSSIIFSATLFFVNPPVVDKVKDRINPAITEYTTFLNVNYMNWQISTFVRIPLAKSAAWANGPDSKKTIGTKANYNF